MTVSIINIGSVQLEEYFKQLPDLTNMAAQLAINGTARGKGMSAIKRQMLDEIAFPAGYLTQDRIKVTRSATKNNLEAVITGRKRATSLARFVVGNPVPNSKLPGGISVRVKKGRTSYLKNAFLVRLKKGASLSEDNYNLGLAVRLQPGEQIANKNTGHKAWLIPGKVALLYGPSVDQVFAGVIEQVAPEIGDLVAGEFFRQFARLSDG